MVIPAYNAERFLPLQLEALDMQSDAPPYEVIVVDNRSSDGTAALVDRLVEEVSYPLRRVSADQHQGPGYARNVGAAHARADLLMFADADDVVSRWWVRNGALAFETSVLWSGGARFMTDEEMIGGVEDIRRAAGDSDAWSPPEAADADEAFPVLMGGDFGVTRDVFLRIGGFDRSLGGVYEDNDLGIRAHLAGVVIDHAPDVRIAFRGKWDEGFRSRLARRSARSHALVAHRYGLTRRSHFPNPWGGTGSERRRCCADGLGQEEPRLGGCPPTGCDGARSRPRDGQVPVAEAVCPSADRPRPGFGRRVGGAPVRSSGKSTARRLAAHVVRSSMVLDRHRHGFFCRPGLRGAGDPWLSGGCQFRILRTLSRERSPSSTRRCSSTAGESSATPTSSPGISHRTASTPVCRRPARKPSQEQENNDPPS
ncbi:glycosyltransferase family A protein [Micrococcus luteus]|uniref:glycosyltransferase family A protein n=1 Tax=Micrococcus luteus TaxID=1270 RepID=UPI0039A56D56